MRAGLNGAGGSLGKLRSAPRVGRSFAERAGFHRNLGQSRRIISGETHGDRRPIADRLALEKRGKEFPAHLDERDGVVVGFAVA